jgi:hypothetical protein
MGRLKVDRLGAVKVNKADRVVVRWKAWNLRFQPSLEAGRLEHFHQSCSDKLEIRWTAVFLAFACVSAQLQGCHGTCAFAEALPKAKNPRGSSLHLFCQCSGTWNFISHF